MGITVLVIMLASLMLSSAQSQRGTIVRSPQDGLKDKTNQDSSLGMLEKDSMEEKYMAGRTTNVDAQNNPQNKNIRGPFLEARPLEVSTEEDMGMKTSRYYDGSRGRTSQYSRGYYDGYSRGYYDGYYDRSRGRPHRYYDGSRGRGSRYYDGSRERGHYDGYSDRSRGEGSQNDRVESAPTVSKSGLVAPPEPAPKTAPVSNL